MSQSLLQVHSLLYGLIIIGFRADKFPKSSTCLLLRKRGIQGYVMVTLSSGQDFDCFFYGKIKIMGNFLNCRRTFHSDG
ncbi:hypothetical protein D3C87_1982050 [compost metagenome]